MHGVRRSTVCGLRTMLPDWMALAVSRCHDRRIALIRIALYNTSARQAYSTNTIEATCAFIRGVQSRRGGRFWRRVWGAKQSAASNTRDARALSGTSSRFRLCPRSTPLLALYTLSHSDQ